MSATSRAASGKSRRRRRPRSTTSFGLTVRVDLLDTKPPVWRRLQLPSTLMLDELHDALQVVFEWDDSHLHRFGLGTSAWDHDGEHFLCPFSVEDGEPEGVPTHEVRVDEVLAGPGDRLFYTYDFGDSWNHRLVVESVGEPVEQVRCTGGRGAAPPEDSGGMWDWDASAAPPFDVAAAQAALERLELDGSVPPAIAELLELLALQPQEAVLRSLLHDADLDGPVQVDETTADEMVRRYAWLLDRVGDGLSLTSAGRLPPVVVTEAMAGLWPPNYWIGKANREELTEPVRRLRASAQRLGLLRVARGRLTVTKAGVGLRGDPERLWRHVAERLAAPPKDAFCRSATALVLLGVAAGGGGSLDQLADVLTAAGWDERGGGGVSTFMVMDGSEAAAEVLDTAGAYGDDHAVTPGGRVLARAALLAS